jgi:hypothetical protein
MRKKSANQMRATKSYSENAISAKSKFTGITLQLSSEAKEKLQKLRLKSLDGRGQMPNVSEVVERLINNALKNEPEMPYPKTG